MQGRGGDSDRSADLVCEAERDWHTGKQRRNAKSHLRKQHHCQQTGGTDKALVVG